MSSNEQEEKMRKLSHNMTSGLSSLVQSVEVIADCWPDNTELIEKIVPLAKEKGHEVLSTWEEIKEFLRNHRE